MKRFLITATLTLFLFVVSSLFAQSVAPDPIVLVPGIGASSNLDVFFDVTPVQKPWAFTDGVKNYDVLIRSLEAKGYILNQNLFVAFYDWRQSNINSATDYLIPIIDQAKLASPRGKVDIIAHSMGGLVARAYIQGNNYQDDVDQLFLIGTPNYGSSDAYVAWEAGNIPSHWDKIIKAKLIDYLDILSVFAPSVSDHYDAIHLFIPSIKELLPLYNYIVDKDTGLMKPLGDMQEQNTVLSNLNNIATSSGAISLFGRVREISVIAGTSTSTLAFIPVVPREANETKLWVDGKPDPINPATDTTVGDNTVLVQSAFFPFPDNRSCDPTREQTADYDRCTIFRQRTITDTNHINLPTEAIAIVFERLGIGPTSIEFSPHYDPKEILSFWFASPVDVKVVDPEGKIVTKDINEISEASYESTSDPLGPKFITIPDPLSGDYHVELFGIGDGEYHMGVSHIDDDSDTVNTVGGTIKIGQGIGYTVSYDPSDTESPADISEPQSVGDEKTAVELVDELISDVERYYKEGLIKGLLIKRSLLLNFNILKSEIRELNGLEDKYENKPSKQIERRIKILEGLIKMHIKSSIELLGFYSKKRIINADAVSAMIEKLNLIS